MYGFLYKKGIGFILLYEEIFNFGNCIATYDCTNGDFMCEKSITIYNCQCN